VWVIHCFFDIKIKSGWKEAGLNVIILIRPLNLKRKIFKWVLAGKITMKSGIDDAVQQGELAIVSWKINHTGCENAIRFAGTVLRMNNTDYVLSRVNHDGTAIAFGEGKFDQPLKLFDVGNGDLRDIYKNSGHTLSCSYIVA